MVKRASLNWGDLIDFTGDLLGSIVGIVVIGFILTAVVRYIYLNFRERRYFKPIRNLFVITAVLALLYYGTNHGWFGNNEPCYSYDLRGCTENGSPW